MYRKAYAARRSACSVPALRRASRAQRAVRAQAHGGARRPPRGERDTAREARPEPASRPAAPTGCLRRP